MRLAQPLFHFRARWLPAKSPHELDTQDEFRPVLGAVFHRRASVQPQIDGTQTDLGLNGQSFRHFEPQAGFGNVEALGIDEFIVAQPVLPRHFRPGGDGFSLVAANIVLAGHLCWTSNLPIVTLYSMD